MGGYSDKLPLLLEKVIDKMKHLRIEQSRFDIFKDELTRSYENFFLEAPYQHSAYYLNDILCEKRWNCDDYLLEIQDMTMEEVQAFIPIAISSLHIEGLVHGALEKQDVFDMFNMVETILNPRPLQPSQFIGERSFVLPIGKKFIYQLPVRDTEDVNSAINYNTHICHVKDLALRNRLSMVAQIAQEPCFNQLRTREQLGYLVFSGVRGQLGQLSFRLIVQSERDPTYLENRVLEFLESLREILAEMTEKEYQAQVDSLIADTLEKYKNLYEESSKYWADIESGFYEFDDNLKDVKELKTITKESLLEFYDKLIMPNSPQASTISVHVQSQKKPCTITKEEKDDDDDDEEEEEEKDRYSVDQLYPVLTYLQLIDKKNFTEDHLKEKITDNGGDVSIQTETGLVEFLLKTIKMEREDAEKVVIKMNQGPSGLSSRDHTQLPENAILIKDLFKFKRRMPLSVAAVPFYSF